MRTRSLHGMGTNHCFMHIHVFGKQKVALKYRHAVRGLSHLATINVCELN